MSFTMNDDFNEQLSHIIGENRVRELEQRGFLAAQIISHRRKKNMTQQELATTINVAKSTIGRLEAGLTQPNYKTLLALSNALNTPLIIDANRDNYKATEIKNSY